MDTFLLTDWITVAGDGGVGTPNVKSIAQSPDQWLELPEHEDVSFFLEVKQITGTVTMNYETAPTKEESSMVGSVADLAVSLLDGSPFRKLVLDTVADDNLEFSNCTIASRPGSPAGYEIPQHLTMVNVHFTQTRRRCRERRVWPSTIWGS